MNINKRNIQIIPNSVELICILDKSGSMNSMRDKIITDINNLIKTQRDTNTNTNVTLVEFDTKPTTIYDRESITKISPFTLNDFVPQGETALRDAIGSVISNFEIKLDKEDIRPESVVVYIITDGEDNHSKEYTKATIKSMIDLRRKFGWKFLFVVSNEAALTEVTNTGAISQETFGYNTYRIINGPGTGTYFTINSNIQDGLPHLYSNNYSPVDWSYFTTVI